MARDPKVLKYDLSRADRGDGDSDSSDASAESLPQGADAEEPFQTPVHEATFFTTPKPTPLPTSVENRIIKLMKKCVHQHKALVRAEASRKRLTDKIKAIKAELNAAHEENEELQIEMAQVSGGTTAAGILSRVQSQSNSLVSSAKHAASGRSAAPPRAKAAHVCCTCRR